MTSASGHHRLGYGLASVGLLAACLCWSAASHAQGIYTCVDAKGRKLTSDRPIADCADREQKVLNPSGTVQSRVGPTLTAAERAEQEARAKAEQEAQIRATEEKRRERALLLRYPNKTVHDRERTEALKQIGIVKAAAVTRADELLKQRQQIDEEMEFYKKDPSKAPPALRRQAEEVVQSLAVQGRFIAEQDAEIRRVNARFDDELTKLQQLWTAQAAGAAAVKQR